MDRAARRRRPGLATGLRQPDLHEQVEAKLARLKGAEAALLLASGWQANAAVLPALLRAAAGQGEVQLYADKLNHASPHHGRQAAGVKQIRYRHNDLTT